MACTENTMCLSSEDDRGLLRNINYLKVLSAVVDKLENVRKSHEAVMIGKGIDTENFKMQDELTDCFRQLDALKNINSVVKEAKENLTEKARALQRVMDEFCLQGGNHTFATGSSQADHSECGSNDIGPSTREQRHVYTVYESDSSSETPDRIIEQVESDPTGRIFRRPESNGNMTYRGIEENHRDPEEIVMAATGRVNEFAERRELKELERAQEEISASSERSGLLIKKSQRRHSNSRRSENRKKGPVRKFYRKFTKCFSGEG